MQEARENPNYPDMVAFMRANLAKCILHGYLSTDEYLAITGSFEEPMAPSAVTFGRGSLELKVDAPIQNEITLRPIIDMTADKIIEYDQHGKPIAVRRAS